MIAALRARIAAWRGARAERELRLAFRSVRAQLAWFGLDLSDLTDDEIETGLGRLINAHAGTAIDSKRSPRSRTCHRAAKRRTASR